MRIHGLVRRGGTPLAGTAVTVFSVELGGRHRPIAKAKTGEDGRYEAHADGCPGAVFVGAAIDGAKVQSRTVYAPGEDVQLDLRVDAKGCAPVPLDKALGDFPLAEVGDDDLLLLAARTGEDIDRLRLLANAARAAKAFDLSEPVVRLAMEAGLAADRLLAESDRVLAIATAAVEADELPARELKGLEKALAVAAVRELLDPSSRFGRLMVRVPEGRQRKLALAYHRQGGSLAAFFADMPMLARRHALFELLEAPEAVAQAEQLLKRRPAEALTQLSEGQLKQLATAAKLDPSELDARVAETFPAATFRAGLAEVASPKLRKALPADADIAALDPRTLEAPELVAEASALRRLHALAGDAGTVKALQDAKIGSSLDVVRRGRGDFVAAHGKVLGGTAGALYDRAKGRVAGAFAVWQQFRTLAPSPEQESYDIDSPELRDLVGELDACSCAHCRSVLSPGAYLVALFDWLSDRGQLDALFDRRPDLRTLTLSCENTNTEIPYILRTVEVLTAAVEDRAGSPLADALDKPWPFTLPVHPVHLAVQAQAHIAGVDLAEISWRLRLRRIPHELGWGPDVRANLVQDAAHRGWGYPNPNPAGTPWVEHLASVPTFLERSGLEWEGLQALLMTGTAEGVGLTPDDACSLDELSLTGLDEAKAHALRQLLVLRAHTGWNLREADLALTWADGLDGDSLGRLAAVSRLCRLTGEDLDVWLAALGHVDTREWHEWEGETSLFARTFAEVPGLVLDAGSLVDAPVIDDIAEALADAIGAEADAVRTALDPSATLTLDDLGRLVGLAALANATGRDLEQVTDLVDRWTGDPLRGPRAALDFLDDVALCDRSGLAIEDWDKTLGEADEPWSATALGEATEVDEPLLAILAVAEDLGLPTWGAPFAIEAVARWKAAVELAAALPEDADPADLLTDIAAGGAPSAWPDLHLPASWGSTDWATDTRKWLGLVDLLAIAPTATLESWVEGLADAATADALAAHAQATVPASLLDSRTDEAEAQRLTALRDGLVAYLLGYTLAEDEADLLAQHLIDAPTEACMVTSRVKEAISATQMFVHQGMYGSLEDVSFTADDAAQWRWLKTYRVWEAGRKIFLWPENWALPELRRDKTPLFEAFEQQLLQGDLSEEHLRTSFLAYGEGLRDVARLRIDAIHREKRPDGSERVHLFGRTRTAPKKLYHRVWTDRAAWSAWQPVPFEIDSVHLLPVAHQGGLRLFWTRFAEQTDDNDEAYWEVTLVQSELRSGGWSAPRESERPASLRIPDSYRGDLADWAEWTAKGPKSKHFLRAVRSGGDLTVELCLDVGVRAEARALKTLLESEYQAAVARFDKQIGNSLFFLGEEFVETLRSTFVEEQEKPFRKQEEVVAGLDSRLRNQFVVGRFVLDACTDTLTLDEMDDREESKVPSPAGMAIADQRFREADNFAIESARTPPSRTVRRMRTAPEANSGLRTLEGSARAHQTVPLTNKAPADGVELVWAQQFKVFSSQVPFILQDDARCFVVDPGAELRAKPLDELDLGREGMMTRAMTVSARPSVELAGSDREYRLVEHYHPYACTILEQMRKRGPFGVLDPTRVGGPDVWIRQSRADLDMFEDVYDARANVEKPHPKEDVAFKPHEAFAAYNWELFFHAPFLVAMRLSAQGRFEEATDWFHTIFDPRVREADVPAPAAYFKVRPLAEVTPTTIAERLERLTRGTLPPDERSSLEAQIARWFEDPFDPHNVAWLRHDAYQKAVVLRYLQHLLAWADSLFRRDTIESIREALPLYLIVAKILGRRPVELDHDDSEGPSWEDIEGRADAFANALVQLETFLPPRLNLVFPGKGNGQPLPVGLGEMAFCVPPNPEWTTLWDHVEDRLFKLRNCMNIDGIVRQLALFEPPIDPALLAAGGFDALDALSDTANLTLNYRFTTLAARAQQLVGSARGFSQALLGALEKEDAEHLASMRAAAQQTLATEQLASRKLSADEARRQLDALEESLASAKRRHNHYISLLGEGLEESLLDEESDQRRLLKEGMAVEAAAQGLKALSSVLHLFPDISIGPFPSSTTGGMSWGSAAAAGADALGVLSVIQRAQGSIAGLNASWNRRYQDWELQHDLAERDVAQIESQIEAAALRIELADREYTLQQRQIASLTDEADFLTSKYTHKDLYTYSSNRLRVLARQSFELAERMVALAREAHRIELGLEAGQATVVDTGWDPKHLGLHAADGLAHELDRLEASYLEENARTFEITKRVSLARLDPHELFRLRASGECAIRIPEALFDLDFPTHLRRRLKAVTVTLPATTGPVTGLNATLRLDQHLTRTSRDEDPTTAGPTGAIALSSGQEDAGLFTLDFSDPRYLPFEHAGAVSNWTLTLAGAPEGVEKPLPQFDWQSIADVVLTLRYTAVDGGDRDAAMARVKAFTEGNGTDATDTEVDAGAILLSARADAPDAWYRLTEEGALTLELPLTASHLPAWVAAGTVSTEQIGLSAVSPSGTALSVDADLGGTPVEVELTGSDGVLLSDKVNLAASLPATLTLRFADPVELDELFVAFTWKVTGLPS